MSDSTDIPRFIPNYFPPLLPGLYALQLHGLGVGLAVYVAVFLSLVSLGWAFILRGWSLHTLSKLRIVLIVASVLAVGISGASISN